MATGPFKVFVTVGTTLFDPLVQAVSHPIFLEQVAQEVGQGRSSIEITIQYGKGHVVPFAALPAHRCRRRQDNHPDPDTIRCTYLSESTQIPIQCHAYRFKPSLQADMSAADWMWSHAGAGSIMEGLECCRLGAGKKLVVVINEELMHNHQWELARALQKRGHLWVVTPGGLQKAETCRTTVQEIAAFTPQPFPPGNATDFPKRLNDYFGFTNDEEEEEEEETDKKKQ